MDGSLSDLVHDYQLTTRYEGVFTIHFHRDPDAPPSAPHRQERWKKIRTLGHGGQGDVLLQTCTDGGRSVFNRAVKRIRLESEHSKRYYRRELESIVKFSHEKYSQYFVKSLGWYATSNKLYIAMEFFPEGDLYAYIRDHKGLTDDECSHIISQVLSGVAVMHEAGFAHRDVKPQNILVYKSPQDFAPSSWWVKLADFGISKKLGAETTGTTLAPGTPLYMAPELLQFDSRSILTENYFKADGKATYLDSPLAARNSNAGGIQQSVISSCRSFFQDCTGVTPEISTLASQPVSQRWTGDFHDVGILPKTPDQIRNIYNIPSMVEEMEIPIAETQWISRKENDRPASMGNLIRNPQYHELCQDLDISLPLHSWIGTGDIDMVRLLVDHGVNANAQDENGRTPLHLSAAVGNVEMVRVLCEGGAAIETTSENGHTPLQVAAMEGHTEVTELLLEKGADIEASDKFGNFTPLGFAASMNHSDVTRLLLEKGANVEATNQAGYTPLISAAKSGSESVTKVLLKHGAHIEATDKSGGTPLIWAARAGSEGVIEHLIHHGAKVNMSEYSGFTPLRVSRIESHDAAKKLLLKAGARMDSSNSVLDSSLHEAARRGYHRRIIASLGRTRANIDEKDDLGRTPLILAAREGHMDTAWLLCKYGADVEAFDHSNYTPLMTASDQGRTSMVTMLIRFGANVLASDIEGNTSMSLASRKGHIGTVACLCNRNAPVNQPNNSGETPLILAANGSHTDMAKELVDAGADINASDNKGFTPLIMAAGQGDVETVRLLVEHKAQLDSTSRGAPAALIEAAKGGHEAVVEVLLEEGATIEAIDIGGETALVHSVRRNNEAVVALLLQVGAYAQAEDEYGEACLMIAVRNKSKAIMDLLTQYGAKKSWLYYRARMSLGY
ncbi:hypothetical protein H9Q72_014355 [Fusarium xylarioides]|uniref:Protein kinase domain-containing protein n=1 Tax=Fusarium xylarioides TaxID=221167 RepID=A0A9P7HDD4_9HYPO|nr:hypothetical protein H9Q72_014355 [Fusarium xylarioides]